MKKIKRCLIAITFIVSLLCLALGLVACESGPKLSELRIENARINFMRGDEFETGDDFAVIAVFDDGTEKDVTEEVTVRQEKGMDMNVPGNYQITVSYGKKKEIYDVYVNDAEDVLCKIELDTTNVTKSYELGDSLSLEGLVLHLTYKNSQNVNFDVETASLKGFDVEIRSESNIPSGYLFTSLGKYTVTVSQSGIKASFDVNVEGINISTVQGALTVGSFYKSKVVSGTALVQEKLRTDDDEDENVEDENDSDSTGPVDSFRHEYTYGDNYTRFNIRESYKQRKDPEDPNSPLITVNVLNTYHCSVDDDGLFVIRLENGKLVTNNMIHPDMINGSPYQLWYYKETVYGIESVLSNLYARAKVCSNHDLKETADEANREYSFSFTGLEQSSNDYDYFETTVSFTLSEDYTIATAEYRQDYYENNSAWAESERTFETNPATGKTVPLVETPSHYMVVTVSQTTGERTEKNEYSRDMFKITSFDLTYDGKVLGDDVLECDVATGSYLISIENILPSTASFTQDHLYFDYEGNRGGQDTWLSNEHFMISQTDAGIRLTVRHGGKWTFYLKTAKVTKKLTVNVTGEDPTSIAPQLWNAASGSFYSGDGKILALNGEVYFYGAVNAYANGAQTAEVVSGIAEAFTLERVKIGGIECFKFSASQTGTYEVVITSTASLWLDCTFTFTVSDAVDYDALLTGTYTAEDKIGGFIYTVSFTRTDEGGLIKGTVTVIRTLVDDDGEPIGEPVTQTFAFYVDDMEITVEHVNGDKLWINLLVTDENKFVLVDQRELRYELTRVSS